jgi:flagellar secretion chaperone FliS
MNHLTQSYNEVELTTEIMTASPHRLIQLLLDKCLYHLNMAKSYIVAKDINKKCYAIGKAMDILDYLRLCLDHNNQDAKELSMTLESIYLYVEDKLLYANMNNDANEIDQAKKILSIIKAGWDGIDQKSA